MGNLKTTGLKISWLIFSSVDISTSRLAAVSLSSIITPPKMQWRKKYNLGETEKLFKIQNVHIAGTPNNQPTKRKQKRKKRK
jgi:hypothetical protein